MDSSNLSKPSLPFSEEEEKQLYERFLSYAFHELRTPLTVVHSYAQLALDKLPAGPDFNNLRRIMSRMIGQSEVTVDMIEELLESVRIPIGRLNLDLTETEANQFVEGAIEHLGDEWRPLVSFSPCNPLQIQADLPRLEKALGVLLKFSLGEQNVRGASQGVNLKASEANPKTLVLELKAPGLNLNRSEQQDLFDLYRPIRERETALSPAGPLDIGLFVAHGVVKAHKGKLKFLEDLPGFILELPVYNSNGAERP